MLRGKQTPRLVSRPEFASEAHAEEAIELARTVGLILDPWQEFLVRLTLAERADGLYAADTVGALVARQNGKGGWLEAVALDGLFLVDDPLTLWTAHQTKTSFEAFLRMKGWIDGSDDLRKRVRRVNNSHGEEGIELRSGARLRFLARSKSSGRGFSPQRIIFDEAQELSKVAVEAMVPSMRAQRNKQAVYTGTVPGPEINNPEQFRRLRDRGREGGSKRLGWAEWSPAGSDDPEAARGLNLDDRSHWAAANPALGYRVTEDALASDRESMDDDSYAREALSVWPTMPDDVEGAIDFAAWKKLHDPKQPAELDESKRTCLAVAVAPDKSWATIGTVGRAVDGRELALVQSRRGIGWVVAEVARLVEKHRPLEVALNPATKAGGLLGDLHEAGVEVRTLTARETQQACGAFQLGVSEGRFAHVGQAELDRAVRAAKLRDRGDAEDWDTRHGVDLSPLQAVTIAAASFKEHAKADYDVMDSVLL